MSSEQLMFKTSHTHRDQRGPGVGARTHSNKGDTTLAPLLLFEDEKYQYGYCRHIIDFMPRTRWGRAPRR